MWFIVKNIMAGFLPSFRCKMAEKAAEKLNSVAI
jgi:hypothetical protein